MLIATSRDIQAPTPNAETAEFWTASTEGRLLVKSCAACGRAHFYPRTMCPHCHSGDTHWKEASGSGVIYSYSVMRRGADPYAIAYVELAEGPRMLTRIVDCDSDDLAIGRPVRVVFRPAVDGTGIPMFTLSDAP